MQLKEAQYASKYLSHMAIRVSSTSGYDLRHRLVENCYEDAFYIEIVGSGTNVDTFKAKTRKKMSTWK